MVKGRVLGSVSSTERPGISESGSDGQQPDPDGGQQMPYSPHFGLQLSMQLLLH
jgi:hypothetical protein